MVENKRIKKFKSDIRNCICPFCGKKLKYYDGALGYEAYRCYNCNLSLDHFGIQIDDL
jgi:tRNA(Ile2) C34 agmatinyltransferase TiaS